MTFSFPEHVALHAIDTVADVAGQLASLANLTSSGSVLSGFAYAVDPVGNRTRVVEANGDRTTWTYDATYHLTREHRTGVAAFCITHVYDPAGNRLQEVADGSRKTFTYDAANQLATSDDSTGRTTYSYDASGNLAIQASPGGRTTNTWDAENRLLLVQAPAGVINTMTYNADGLRTVKEDSSGAANYLWDGLILLSEFDAAGNTQAVYTQQPAQYGGLVSGRRKTGGVWVPSYYHYDGLGSTDRLTDAAQAVTDSYSYYAYGAVAGSSTSTVNPFRWVGQLGYYDESDLAQYYIRARHYDPGSGRWLSEDPIQADINLYRYVGNNSVNETDPEGLASWRRGTLKYEVTSAGETVPPVVLPDKGDSGLTRAQIQALVENAAKAWAKKAGTIVFKVDEPCPKGTAKGPGKPINWTKEETGNLTIFVKLKKKFGVAGPWEVVVVTDPTTEKDQKSLGKTMFAAKYKKSFGGKGGPCLEPSCDETSSWPVYV